MHTFHLLVTGLIRDQAKDVIPQDHSLYDVANRLKPLFEHPNHCHTKTILPRDLALDCYVEANKGYTIALFVLGASLDQSFDIADSSHTGLIVSELKLQIL